MGAATMENGLQTSAIYWETQNTPYRGVFGGVYGGKWTWKAVDDHIRSFWGMQRDGRSTPIVFAGERLHARDYQGHPEVYDVKPIEKKFGFAFSPTGTVPLLRGAQVH